MKKGGSGADISTHALTEGDRKCRGSSTRGQISTHALTEGDYNVFRGGNAHLNFNSRPHGGRQAGLTCMGVATIFQLTPSRRATMDQRRRPLELFISTHALTEGDLDITNLFPLSNISTHALTEGDEGAQWAYQMLREFQLTPSRRATTYSSWMECTRSHFNSRPHGGRRWLTSFMSSHKSISTHALTEGDTDTGWRTTSRNYFNSRPHGGRHPQHVVPPHGTYFNSRPHGGRPYYLLSPSKRVYFNSRPHGGRRSRKAVRNRPDRFQLTPSRRATP